MYKGKEIINVQVVNETVKALKSGKAAGLYELMKLQVR